MKLECRRIAQSTCGACPEHGLSFLGRFPFLPDCFFASRAVQMAHLQDAVCAICTFDDNRHRVYYGETVWSDGVEF
jgi:hypothetical protein